MNKQSELIVLAADPNSAVAEAYRTLRVALSKQLAQGMKVFCFVSAWPGDGKSMVCTNVAASIGQLHQKVLLIDGDLRRPTISRVFGAHQKPGITEDLESGQGSIHPGYKTKYANLSVLPRGMSEQNPSNLLAPDRLARVIASLRDTYDVIIIDTPPLSACSDALLWGSQADGAAMVISPLGWDGEVEARYKQQLVDHGVPVFGAILNGAQGAESHGYGYGYGYGRGKGYGNYGDRGKKQARGGKKSQSAGFQWPWQRPDDGD